MRSLRGHLPALVAGVLCLSSCGGENGTADSPDGGGPPSAQKGSLAGEVVAIPDVAHPGEDVGVVVVNNGTEPLHYGLDLRVQRRTSTGWENASEEIYGRASSGARLIRITVGPGERSGPKPEGLRHVVRLPADAEPGQYRILVQATGDGSGITLEGTFRVAARR